MDNPKLPDKTENSPCGKEIRLLKNPIPADSGTYHVNINPGCIPEMKIWIRIESESGNISSDTVGPILLQGGACGLEGN